MIYTINFIYSILCSYGFSKYYTLNKSCNIITYFIYLSPIWIIWLILCGGQYYVGTDYPSYYSIFKSGDVALFYNKNEILFAWIVELLHYTELPPQTLYYVFYSICFTFFILILRELNQKNTFIYILLYFTLSNLFHNQLNGLRQSIAIYICTYATILLFSKHDKIKFILTLIFATTFHTSSLFIFPFIFIKQLKKNITPKLLYILLAISTLCAIFGSYNWIFNYLGFLIPPQYKFYLGGLFDSSVGFGAIVTKLVYVPIYILTIKLYSKKNILTEQNKLIFLSGFCAYCFRLFFLQNMIFSRISDLFVLLSIFPIYYYLAYLYQNKKYFSLILLISYFSVFYLIKILLLPEKEYLYNSIYL